MMRVIVVTLGLTTLLATLKAAPARHARLPEDPRDVPREAHLTVMQANADLDGDGQPEALLVVNALTGDADPARGAEVICGVAAGAPKGERGKLLWARHVSAATGLPAHDGEITAVDLDGDARSELILSYDRSLTAERIERWAEIYSLADVARPRLVWEGSWESDTRRDQATPADQREWRRREVDYKATRAAAGKAIVFRVVYGHEAGSRVDPPRVATEKVAVPLRAPA